MGIPMGAVRQALQKEGKDPGIIELDPEKSLSSQIDNTPLKDSEEYGKFFKVSWHILFHNGLNLVVVSNYFPCLIFTDAQNGHS